MVDAAWIALSLTSRLGGKTLRALRTHFDNDLSVILSADTKQLREVPGIGPKIAQSIQQIDLEKTLRAIDRWQNAGVNIVTINDPGYPAALLTLDDAPPTVFIRGTWPESNNRTACAIVGTRRPTSDAYQFAQNLSQALAQRGQLIVSGLAVGIDAAAHIGALATGDGITVAVLGNGVLNLYPPENAPLAQAIITRGGALLSEVSPDAPVGAPGLVARNRLITGLSDRVVVVETSADGGAMHAARFARLQGKSIYAVENSASGYRALLSNGAISLSPNIKFNELPF